MTPAGNARHALPASRKTWPPSSRKSATELPAKNKADGEAFLATNKTKPGVVTLPDGLQYKVITDGTGEMPGDNDTVTVNYRGTLVDGTEFDSSCQARPTRGSFPSAGSSSAAGREALKLMKAGSKWQLFIPSELGLWPEWHVRPAFRPMPR